MSGYFSSGVASHFDTALSGSWWSKTLKRWSLVASMTRAEAYSSGMLKPSFLTPIRSRYALGMAIESFSPVTKMIVPLSHHRFIRLNRRRHSATTVGPSSDRSRHVCVSDLTLSGQWMPSRSFWAERLR